MHLLPLLVCMWDGGVNTVLCCAIISMCERAICMLTQGQSTCCYTSNVNISQYSNKITNFFIRINL